MPCLLIIGCPNITAKPVSGHFVLIYNTAEELIMQIFDISLGIHPGLPVWPGDPPLVLERIATIGDESVVNVSRMASGVHIGTHVDAPLHFIEGGASIDQLDPAIFIGPAYVAEFEVHDHLDRTIFEAAEIPPGVTRLLLKTPNSQYWRQAEQKFEESFLAVSAEGADWLVEAGVRLVGVDYLSVAPFHDSVPTHTRLLSEGIVVIEGLDLSSVEAGWYTLYCLPLKLIGSEGAQARAILAREG
jgi:arylformamidase